MSTASTTTKSWLLPVITAAFGYALTKRADTVALLGVGAGVLFGFLDANYLKQEAFPPPLLCGRRRGLHLGVLARSRRGSAGGVRSRRMVLPVTPLDQPSGPWPERLVFIGHWPLLRSLAIPRLVHRLVG